MPNRPNTRIPIVYMDAFTFDYTSRAKIERRASPLHVNDLNYLHYHNTLEIGLCDSGRGICYVEDAEFPFKPGDVHIVFPFQRHISVNSPGQSSEWYWLNLDCAAILGRGGFTDIHKINHWLTQQMALCGIFTKQQYPEINRLVKMLINSVWEDAETTPYYNELIISYLYTLILELLRASHTLPKLPLTGNKHLIAVSPALELINQRVNTGENVSLPELAAAAAMSVTNFRRCFNEAAGMPPKEYITMCRLRKAEKLLLQTDQSILSISEQIGFSDVSGFNRQFLQRNGTSPSQFRKRYKP